MHKINKDLHCEIIDAYTKDLVPMIEIANWFQVSRQAIWKVLRKAGVDTSKRKYPVECTYCGKTFYKTRAQIRNRKRLFCCQEHYYLYLEVVGGPGKYKANRVGRRKARQKVGRVFDLQPEHVVHHEDGDNLNNSYDNLRVFACQGDHVQYHRGVNKPEPIWDGRESKNPVFF